MTRVFRCPECHRITRIKLDGTWAQHVTWTGSVGESYDPSKRRKETCPMSNQRAVHGWTAIGLIEVHP